MKERNSRIGVLLSKLSGLVDYKPKTQRSEILPVSLEALEARQMMSTVYAPIDGTGNNLLHVEWGSTNEDFLRIVKAAYGDGVSSPAGQDLPSARAISNLLSAQSADMTGNARGLSDYIYAWGQFLDHDIDLTNTQSGDGAETLNIAVPKGDPYFDPASTGTQVIPLTRSAYDLATGTSKTNVRQQINAITAFIDGSQIYGSDEATAASLRMFTGGKLKTSDGNLLPTDETGFFVAGDIRVDENTGLIAMQTMFMREHNRVATQMAQHNPTWSDEEVYQHARRVVIGELQRITYNEFLPALLGSIKITPYKGYNAKVNPGISNEFATAAFRFGHSLLNDDIEFLDNNGNPVREEISLAESFFNPDIVKESGIDGVLKYLASDNANELDNKIVDSLRNFLFGPPGAGGLDLAALNIQRGRDHGLADYNTTRAAYGLKKVTTFAQITANVDLQKALKSIYGSVDKIDLWVGLLAEDHVKGSSVGQLTGAILVNQFTRLRDGDRFWYQNQLKGKELAMVEKTTLAEVIKRNTGTYNLQENVFFFKTQVTGKVFNDANKDGVAQKNEQGLAGRKLQLLDADGAVVGTATTDRAGMYSFKGIGLGRFTLKEVLGPGVTITNKQAPEAIVTRGSSVVVNIGNSVTVAPPPSTPTPPGRPPVPPAPKPNPIARTTTSTGPMTSSIMDDIRSITLKEVTG
jgi:peroxidase